MGGAGGVLFYCLLLVWLEWGVHHSYFRCCWEEKKRLEVVFGDEGEMDGRGALYTVYTSRWLWVSVEGWKRVEGEKV